jgi:hypothetical protein
MVKENLLPNPDLLYSLLFFKAFLSSPAPLPSKLLCIRTAYQLRSLRVTPYERKGIIFGKRPGL